ncbi:integrase, catalytic region, zinc finger, CCHC-type containing protein [Tanacetum coccineum]|uniref:Integrase, catalytic region, zinc finger, CCHC-type containing protein n=1 Tax=Tanacetum coccineum TaxID=301880 RepID=A0ABQ5DBE1_9ASTR
MQVVQVVLWYLDSGCSKHMTGNRSKLKNFVEKFIGTVRFGNDHFGAIMGYGDYVIGDSVISRVYYVEGLGHNLFSVGQFCDSDLEIAFRKHSCFVRDMNGVELLKGSRSTNLYTISLDDIMKSSPICLLSKASKTKSWMWHRRLNHLNFCTINDLAQKDLVRGLPRLKFEKDHLYSACVGIFHQKSVPRTPQQNSVVKRQNRTLVEAACTMLIFPKALMFLWAEAVATALFGAFCYPTNDSKDLGKLQSKADIGIFVGYAPNRKGFQIYNKRTRRIMETIHVTFDELLQTMAPVHIGSGPEPMLITPGQFSSGLIPNQVNATNYVLPTDKDLELLFQPMFNEYFEVTRFDVPVPLATAVNAHVVSQGTSVTTTFAQDAPSISFSPSSSRIQPPVIQHDVAIRPTNEDTPITQATLHPSNNPVTGEPGSAQSSLGDVSMVEPNQVTQPPDHLRKWSKDHPLDNIIGNPSCPVSTKKQLAFDALWCCFHTKLSKVEPKNFKMAMIEDC